MKKTIKYSVANQYYDLKTMFKGGRGKTEDFNDLSNELVNKLGELSLCGVRELEGVTVNLWKDRVWFLIEKAGLLPKYKDPEDVEYKEIVDEWYKEEEEDGELDDEEAYKNPNTGIEL